MYSSITVTWTSIFGNWYMVPCPAIQVPFLCRITRFPCICISSYNQLTRSTKQLGKRLNRACNLHSVVFQYLQNSQRGGRRGEASSVIWVAAWEKKIGWLYLFEGLIIGTWSYFGADSATLHALGATWCHIGRWSPPSYSTYVCACMLWVHINIRIHRIMFLILFLS
mgnify:CR=1 FL=1